jgi:single-strand DNA-binding protein
MKASLNRVELIGNVGTDAEIKTTQGGQTLMNLNLATTRSKKDQSGKWSEESTWHRITLWNRLAEIAGQYCQKGRQVYIEGHLQNNEWVDQDGNKRYGVSIVASKLLLLGSPDGKKHKPVNDNRDNMTAQGDDNEQLPF